MKDFFSIIDEDVYVSENIEALYKLYNGNFENKPISIILCIQGELTIKKGIKAHTVKPNQIMLYLPDQSGLKSYSTSPDFKGRIMCLSDRLLIENFNMENNLWEKSFQINENPVISINEDVAHLFEHYGKLIHLRMVYKERMYHKEVITTLLKALVYELFCEISCNIETPGKHLLKQGDILFKKFITLLSSTQVKPRMVTWYAQQLCVTPKYLSTTCKNVSGKTANTWINQFVIKDISNLLQYSDKSIKEISEYLDFPNLSFFGKYVKAHIGYSPKEYRRYLKESN